jgi:sortase (surface protein transpeptidase)
VFYNTRRLQIGANIQYYSGGQVFNYVVTNVVDYPNNADWAAIVAAGTSDLTLITCNGVFDPSAHEYNLRNVVFAKKTAGPVGGG